MMGFADNIAKPGGKFTVQFVAGQGHCLFDPDGKRVGTAYGSAIQARARCGHQQKLADAAARRIVRPCMCCRKEFQSDGIGNRLCQNCRGASDAAGEPQRPYIAKGMK